MIEYSHWEQDNSNECHLFNIGDNFEGTSINGCAENDFVEIVENSSNYLRIKHTETFCDTSVSPYTGYISFRVANNILTETFETDGNETQTYNIFNGNLNTNCFDLTSTTGTTTSTTGTTTSTTGTTSSTGGGGNTGTTTSTGGGGNTGTTTSTTSSPTGNIYLDQNGVTIKCPNSDIGYTQQINGKNYKVVDRELLVQMITDEEDVTCVCTTQITNMSNLFRENTTFNQEIGNWDTSNVINMSGLFEGFNQSPIFNKDISHWNTSNVKDMSEMFYRNHVFNQDIGGWDTSSLTNMKRMFNDNSVFNKDIGGWDTSKVTNMNEMFAVSYGNNASDLKETIEFILSRNK